MKQADHAITIPRAVAALFGGAVAGALVFFLQITVLVALDPLKLDDMAGAARTTNIEFIVTLAAYLLAFFAAGIFLAGTPLWWLLHRNGRRNWFDATGLGAVLCLAGFVLTALIYPRWQALALISYLTENAGGITSVNDRLTADGWAALLRGASGIAIAGACAGLTIWIIAYRRRLIAKA